MKLLCSFLIFLVAIVGCSSNEKRTRYTDKNMRVMLYPNTISPDHYARIQTALVQSNSFTVIDRSYGLEAIKQEQERIHRNESDRYDDREKFSHWGRLYGVGAVVVAHAQCVNRPNSWRVNELRNYCQQFLNLIDANTGEVVLGVEAENNSELNTAPDWNEAVEKLIQAYPKYFSPEQVSERLERYKEESKERALREKELKT